MSYVDQVMNEIKETESTAPASTGENTSVESTTSEQAPAETSGNTTEQPTKTKKEKSSIPKESKAEFAFRKQLAKITERNNSELSARDKKYDELKAEFDAFKEAHPKQEEPVKMRKDFKNDEEYLQYYMGKFVDDRFNNRDADAAKKAEEERKKAEDAQRLEKQKAARLQYFAAATNETFQGEELENFKSKMKFAIEHGLNNVLEASPVLQSYIFGNKNGPLVLNYLLNNKEAFTQILTSNYSTPTDLLFDLHDMAREARASVGNTQSEQTRKLPTMGKPGAVQGGGHGNMFSDDKALIDFIRKPHRR